MTSIMNMCKKSLQIIANFYTQTHSLIYAVICDDVYERMKEDLERFDTSDYPKDNIYNIPPVNKKKPELMKDELNGELATEFVALRSKMYALRKKFKDFIKKAKGLKSNVVKNNITFDNYLDCLFNEKEITREQRKIISHFHHVYTQKESKMALSPHDNKRYVRENCIDTYAWGHIDIPRREETDESYIPVY